MNIKQLVRTLLLISAAYSTTTQATFAPTNFFVPYDQNLRLPDCPNTKWRFGANLEYGNTASGRDWDSKKRNVLRICDDKQNVIAGVKAATTAVVTADADSILSHISTFGGDPVTGGSTRGSGLFTLNGDFSMFDITPYGQYILPVKILGGDLGVQAYIPIRSAKIENVKYTDLMPKEGLSPFENYIKTTFTQDFTTLKAKVKALGNLDLNNWNKTGLGDAVLMLDWVRDFKQDKEHLKNVSINGRLGVSLPTGEKKSEDKAFSFPLGNDGAWGIPLGLSMNLDFAYKIRMGVDVDFLVLFDETRTRRLKTEEQQTEFFLLNKGQASLDHGLTWKFGLYLQGVHIYEGLSLKAAYQYIKHDDDKFSEKDSAFSHSIVNTANSLKEWNVHNLILQANYDLFDIKDFAAKPQLSLFYKIPLAGKGVITAYTFGGQLAVNF